MVYNPDDSRLYYANDVASAPLVVNSCDLDGSNPLQTTSSGSGSWGAGFGILPDDWAAAHTNGQRILSVRTYYGSKIVALDPSTDGFSATTLVSYVSSHKVNDYDSGDAYNGIAWVGTSADGMIVVSGKDASAGGANFWFYDPADILNATNTYDPQPVATLNVQDKLLESNVLYGMTYDSTSNVVYAYEGAWDKPTIVHAWSVVPEPVTLVLLAMGAALGLGRKRRA